MKNNKNACAAGELRYPNNSAARWMAVPVCAALAIAAVPAHAQLARKPSYYQQQNSNKSAQIGRAHV